MLILYSEADKVRTGKNKFLKFQEWFYKRPASKRPNFTKLKSFHPFFPPWEKLLKGEHEILAESNTKVPELPSSIEEFAPRFCVIRGDHFPDYRVKFLI
jgi:hypothetical protein